MVDKSNPTDDIDAIRVILEALGKLGPDDQRRVLGYVQDKLGVVATTRAGGEQHRPAAGGDSAARSDIRTFITAKSPSNDVQFAAAVAYFYAFEASEASKKPEIGAADLQDATRQAGRERLGSPIKTLNNANATGYLDKGSTRGMFKINTVGENLVAMTLPASGAAAPTGRPRKRATRSAKHK